MAILCLYRLKNLTSDAAVIVESLRKSKTGLLEISEDQTKIRRSQSKPLPEYTEEYKDALKHKSIYMVSGLVMPSPRLVPRGLTLPCLIACQRI